MNQNGIFGHYAIPIADHHKSNPALTVMMGHVLIATGYEAQQACSIRCPTILPWHEEWLEFNMSKSNDEASNGKTKPFHSESSFA